MKQPYVLQALRASATVVVAGTALLGCGSDDGNKNPIGYPGTGGGAVTPGGSAGMGTPGTGGSVTTPQSSGGSGVGPATGTGGMKPVGGGNGGTSSTGAGGSMMPGGGTAGATSGGGTAGTSGGGTAGTSGGAPPMGGAAGGAGMPMAGSCGPEATNSAADLGDPMKKGPWTPTSKAATGPTGASTLFYPTELGKGGVLHPVFHWGCGAGSQPAQYADHLNLLASYGFVVIANASGSMPAKASLDWILAENDKMGSMFYQKLDPKRAGIGGHSLGALETFQAAADPRIGLYVLVCGGSGSGTTGAANIHAPSIFLGGENEMGTVNFGADYDAITKAPSVFVTKTSTDHIYCARNNLGPWVAFMRWQFCGETKWKAEFDATGTYCKSPWLACKSKGF